MTEEQERLFDKELAQKIFGWTEFRHTQNRFDPHGWEGRRGDEPWATVPHFHDDYEGAFYLVWKIGLPWKAKGESSEGQNWVSFWYVTEPDLKFNGVGETLALAICEATLKWARHHDQSATL